MFVLMSLDLCLLFFFFFKQKTAYEMRISDWSSDVCSSDLRGRDTRGLPIADVIAELDAELAALAPRDIVLVGHSQAGNLMPSLAALRPHAFRRLVYVSCSIPLPGQTVLQMMGSGVHGSHPDERSEESRVGKECVSTCRSRWLPDH